MIKYYLIHYPDAMQSWIVSSRDRHIFEIIRRQEGESTLEFENRCVKRFKEYTKERAEQASADFRNAKVLGQTLLPV